MVIVQKDYKSISSTIWEHRGQW